MDKERQYKTCLYTAEEVAAFTTKLISGLVLPGCCVRKYVLKRKFQRTSRTMEYCRIADGLTCSSFTLHTHYSLSLSLGQLRYGGRNYHFQGTYEQEDSHQDHIGKQKYLTNKFVSGMIPKNKIGRRKANRLRPRAVDIHHAITAENATSSR